MVGFYLLKQNDIQCAIGYQHNILYTIQLMMLQKSHAGVACVITCSVLKLMGLMFVLMGRGITVALKKKRHDNYTCDEN
jgi:hypothetical protein